MRLKPTAPAFHTSQSDLRNLWLWLAAVAIGTAPMLPLHAIASSPRFTTAGRCVLQVDGHTYINGRCTITTESNGSLEFEGDKRDESSADYFAYVFTDQAVESATGYWNGVTKYRKAQDNLGELSRQGDCWVNVRATVCAKAEATHWAGTPLTDLQGVWAIGGTANCNNNAYLWSLVGDEGMQFRSENGQIDLEEIVEMTPEGFTSMTTQSRNIAIGTIWFYHVFSSTKVMVTNRSSGVHFVLIRCSLSP